MGIQNSLQDYSWHAYINSKIAKQRMKRWHDQLISNKEFQKGQRVLLYDSRLHIFPRKLKSWWIGPFSIHQVHSNEVVELLNSNSTDTFKVNAHRLKPFIEPFNQDKEEVNLLEPQQSWPKRSRWTQSFWRLTKVHVFCFNFVDLKALLIIKLSILLI